MAKGGDFEREVAKLLSLWWTQETRDDVIWRTDASGARATARKKSGKKTAFQHGDLTFTDPCAAPLFQVFSIECKTGYARKLRGGETVHWCIIDSIDSKQKETIFDKMWQQAMDDAASSCRTPLLVFRRNKRTPCISIDRSDFHAMQHFFGPVPFEYVTIHTFRYDVVIMLLKDFCEWTPSFPAYTQRMLKDKDHDSGPIHRELPKPSDKLAFIRARRQCNHGN